MRASPRCGWVLYDGDCPICQGFVRRFRGALERRGYAFESFQTPWVQQRFGLHAGEPLAEMKVLTADGRVFGGADAIVQMARGVWWAWPLYALARVPGAMAFLRRAYRAFAARRYCFGGACSRST